MKGEESQTAEVVNVEALLPQDRDYLTYQVDILISIETLLRDNRVQGSFTTHGFAEGVTWLVLTNPISVSSRTLARCKLLNLRFISSTHPLCWSGCSSCTTAAPPAPG